MTEAKAAISNDFLTRSGEIKMLMQSINWAATPMGTAKNWLQSLRTSISICLGSPLPMMLFWGADLVQFYNDAYVPLLAAKHPKALGQRAQECWCETWDVIEPILTGVLATGQATSLENQLRLINRYGYLEECYFTFCYSPIEDETGAIAGVLMVATETTAFVNATKQIEHDTLKAEVAQLYLITDTLPVLISFVDAEQRYRFNNREYEVWLGYSATEVYGKYLWEVLGESAYEAIRPYIEQVLAGQQVIYETQIPYITGGTRYIRATYIPRFNSQGTVEGFVALVNDISEQKQAEAALSESEARFRQMTDTAPVLVWMSGTDKLCNYFNQFWLDFTGRTLEQELGNGWAEGVHPDDFQRCLDIYANAFDARQKFKIDLSLK